MYIFVYKTTNLINHKQYIGVHKTTDLEDGYIGNGIHSQRRADRLVERGRATPFQKAVSMYGYGNFSREVLRYFDSYEEALSFERQIVTLEAVQDENYYNICLGGGKSPTTGIGHSVEARAKMSIQRKGNWLKGEKNPKAKLSADTVSEIRRLYLTKTVKPKFIARKYLVSVCTVRDIVGNRTWITSDKDLIESLIEARKYFNSVSMNYVRTKRGRKTREQKIQYLREWRKRNPDYHKNRKATKSVAL